MFFLGVLRRGAAFYEVASGASQTGAVNGSFFVIPMLEPLPIDAVLPELTAALASHSAVVLRAPPGAGKTTRVPPAILEAGLAGDKQIVMLEPRRLAARAAAARIAAERRGQLGNEIGYQVRFERRAGPAT